MKIMVLDLVLDPESYRVWKAGRLLPLSTFQFNLLRVFMEHPGKVLTHHDLAQHWAHLAPAPTAIRRGITRLRKALDQIPGSSAIRTVRTVGYALDETDSAIS